MYQLTTFSHRLYFDVTNPLPNATVVRIMTLLRFTPLLSPFIFEYIYIYTISVISYWDVFAGEVALFLFLRVLTFVVLRANNIEQK